MRRRLIPAVLLGAAVACATNPVTGRREFTLMSEAQEISIGRESDPQIKAEMGVYDDPELQRYVSDIGMRLAKLSERPNLPWQSALGGRLALLPRAIARAESDERFAGEMA